MTLSTLCRSTDFLLGARSCRDLSALFLDLQRTTAAQLPPEPRRHNAATSAVSVVVVVVVAAAVAAAAAAAVSNIIPHVLRANPSYCRSHAACVREWTAGSAWSLGWRL